MNDLSVDQNLIAAIAGRLDLRAPNRDALESVATAVSLHYDKHQKDPPFEGVVDVATGVGKTFVMAGAIEYFAAQGHRNFAVVAPGATILRKTLRNFTQGDAKSLLSGMEVRPEVITSETFDSPLAAFQMDDEESIKIYVFTVQSLIKPTSKQGRRTHEFRESFGDAFYQKLTEAEDLIIFADEHHSYYGGSFSKAIRNLKPHALIGLTATPHPKTPEEAIIYRYPLAAAIADQFVKTPVIVGRRDERVDDRTKLADGARLLEMKRKAVHRYASETGNPPVNPVMLVVAQTIDDAEKYAAIMDSPDFFDGRFQGKVLTIHSEQSDAALADLERIEHPSSPVRAVISVGMLKEGWDVKNVYVIASMRASVSEILTEQTLGRGLRLPFGAYTGIEMLDTLEVVAHESYEVLLKKADALKEGFVDSRTLLARDQDGNITMETLPVHPQVYVSSQGEAPTAARPFSPASASNPTRTAQPQGGFTISNVEDRTANLAQQEDSMSQEISARPELPAVELPVIRMKAVFAQLTLLDVSATKFEKLGQQHAADPETLLRRTVISAERALGNTGASVRLKRRAAKDKVEGAAETTPLNESREYLAKLVSESPEVPARLDGGRQALRLVDAYITGLGQAAVHVLGAYPERAAEEFRRLLREAQAEFHAKPSFEETVERTTLRRVRAGRPETSGDLAGRFKKGVGYEGWHKSYFPQVWFDSTPEFEFAGIVDNAEDVEFWVRLVLKDIEIMYTSGARHYNPDFLVRRNNGSSVLVEVKADSQVASEEVKMKREAAERWARHATEAMGEVWEYLLITETDIRSSKGSWTALRAAAR